MPKFECSDCGEKFNSKEKRRIHEKKKHGETVDESSGTSLSVFGSKKIGAALIIIFMIGLPLGGGVFYSSLSPSKGSSSYNYTGNPPEGYEGIPKKGEIPEKTVLSEPLEDHEQVYLMAKGGSVDIGEGFKPAVLLQYSCDNCPQTVSSIERIASEFNQNERHVFVAPYRDMESEVAVSGLKNVTKFEEFDSEKVENAICGKLGEIAVNCAFKGEEKNESAEDSGNSSF